MLLEMAKIRGLKRKIFQVPLISPKLSAYWLNLVTSTNFFLAKSLVDSLKNDVICQNSTIRSILPHPCLSYHDALKVAFDKIAEVGVASSWTDAFSSSSVNTKFWIHPPKEGLVKMTFRRKFTKTPASIFRCFCNIGGRRGWYYMNWAWVLRGFVDKILGGVGLRRGRAEGRPLRVGDALDFWRVLIIDPDEYRLVLYAEMKLPGEAWLEFTIKDGCLLQQSAIFRPLGLWGRLYWYLLIVPHFFLLRGLINQVIMRAK